MLVLDKLSLRVVEHVCCVSTCRFSRLRLHLLTTSETFAQRVVKHHQSTLPWLQRVSSCVPDQDTLTAPLTAAVSHAETIARRTVDALYGTEQHAHFVILHTVGSVPSSQGTVSHVTQEQKANTDPQGSRAESGLDLADAVLAHILKDPAVISHGDLYIAILGGPSAVAPVRLKDCDRLLSSDNDSDHALRALLPTPSYRVLHGVVLPEDRFR